MRGVLRVVVASFGKVSWAKRQAEDVFVRKATEQSFRSRAAFKLIEIDDVYGILRGKQLRVLELGAAPGSWSQVVMQRLAAGSTLVSVDLDPVEGLAPPADVAFHSLVGDACDDATLTRIFKAFEGRKIHLVLSDMSPQFSGELDGDKDEAAMLLQRAVMVAEGLLKKGGTMVIKCFQGPAERATTAFLRVMFQSVERVKPSASRQTSAEFFALCRGFKATALWEAVRRNPQITLGELNALVEEEFRLPPADLERFQQQLQGLFHAGLFTPAYDFERRAVKRGDKPPEPAEQRQKAFEKEFVELLRRNPDGYPNNFHELADIYLKEKEQVRDYLVSLQRQLEGQPVSEYADLDIDRRASPQNPVASRLLSFADPDCAREDDEMFDEAMVIVRSGKSVEQVRQDDEEEYQHTLAAFQKQMREEFQSERAQEETNRHLQLQSELQAADNDPRLREELLARHAQDAEAIRNLEALRRLEEEFKEDHVFRAELPGEAEEEGIPAKAGKRVKWEKSQRKSKG